MPALPKLTNTKPHIERRIHRALEDARAKRGGTHAPGIMLSSVGKCIRVLYGELHGVPEESQPEGRALMIFALGEEIEAHVLDLLRRAGFQVSDRDAAGKQWAVSAYDGRVRGRVDARILPETSRFDLDLLLEVKSAKAARFDELVTLGSYEAWSAEYADTLHAYLGFGSYEAALVVVYCKDDSRLWVEKITFDPDRFTRVRLKVERVLASETAPERPREATSQYCQFCKWCSRNEWCWGPLAETRFDP